MVRMHYLGTWSTWGTRDMPSITDMATIEVDSRLILVSTSGGHGTLMSWEWQGDRLVLRDQLSIRGNDALPAAGGVTLAVVEGAPLLLSHGGAGQGLSVYGFDTHGRFTDEGEMGAGALTLETVLWMPDAGGQDYVFGAARGQPGLQIWRADAQGDLSFVGDALLGLSGDGPDLPDLAHWAPGNRDYLLALDPMAGAVTLQRVQADGTLAEADRLSPADGLPVQTPTELAVVSLAGEDYALVGASGSSSISVLWLNAGQGGRMIAVDHVIDDRNSRFEGLTVMEVLEHAGRVFVLAAGRDEGLSLLTLLPGGQLMMLDTLVDQVGAPLGDVTAVRMAVQDDGALVAFVSGEGWDGVSVLDLQAGTLAPVQIGSAGNDRLSGGADSDMIDGGAGNDTLQGGAGDDILIDGTGRDVLQGGAGADVFVLRPDSETDRIMDFTLGEDRINLSLLGRVYSLDALQMTTLTNGARIHFGDERLDVFSHDGRPIDTADLTLEMLFDLAHMPVAPLPVVAQRLQGTDTDDRLQGGAGNDTLLAGAGADEVLGMGGNDLINASFEDPDFDPVSAQVVRLFQATLGRIPALEGHFSWTQRIQSGEITGLDAAADLVASREFQIVYGPTSDSAFVTLLFQNVLGRDPGAGLSGWVSNLQRGMSREEVVWRFSESAEFQNAMAGVALDYSAAAYQAAWTDDVYRLFLATLGREPNLQGLLAWADNLAAGMSYLDAISGFVAGREFQAVYGPTTDAQFVTLLYQNVLGRAPGQSGLDGWVANLGRGMTREEVVERFAQSPEFVATSFDGLLDYMQAAGLEDVIEGGAGDDTLFGGALCDRFVFDMDDGGRDVIVGIEAWDEVQITGADFANTRQLWRALEQQGDDLVLELGPGATLVFADTARADLSEEMFILL